MHLPRIEGTPLEVYGACTVCARLDGIPVIARFQVAQVMEDAVLGTDVLGRYRAQWDWNDSRILLNNKKACLDQVTHS